MVQLLNSIYLGAAKPDDYGKAAGVVELLPFDYYLGAAVPSHGKPTVNVLLSGVSPLTLVNAVKLNYVKAFGKCEQASTPTPTSPVDILCNNGVIKVKDDELPVGYKRLLDVYFDGDSYFETGQKLTGNDVVTLTLQADSSAGQNVFGAYSGTGASAINLSLYIYASASSQSYFRSNQTLLRPTLGTGKRTISFGNGSTSGFLQDVTYDIEEFETTDTAQIGALPHSTSPKFAGYFYGNITIGNRLKYIPCERVSDGAIGYYETVNGEFLENQGTGTPTTSGYDTSHLTEIYYDGTQEVVSVSSPNLLNPADANFVVGKSINESGSITDSLNNFYTSYYMPVKPSTSYVATGRKADNTISAYTRICWYNSSKTFISRGTYTINTPTILTSPANAAYARITCAPYNSSAALTLAQIKEFNWIFQEGTAEPVYQPYMTPETATCQPLLSVGTYKDSQNITNGAITRNVGIKVFDGTEGWTTIDQYSRISIQITTMKNSSSPRSMEAYCNYFENLHNGEPISDVTTGQFYLAAPQRVYFHISQSTVEAWKAWLASQYAAGTPVIVVYPLATPTTETVTGQTLTIAQGTNIVTAEGSVDDLELEISYKAYAEVTVEEIEAVNTDENVEVTIG